NSGYTDPGKAELTADALPKSSAVYKSVIAAMYTPTAAHDFTPTVYITDPTDDAQTISGGEGDEKYSLNFYSPLSENYGTTEKNAEWNNYSPVMVLEYRGFKFVMTGDAEEDNLGEFVAKVNAAKTDGVSDKYDVFTDGYCANVIKAGHHGSENATTTEFLEVMTSPAAVGSTYSVISCGTGNSYGHPHAAALNRITGIGITQENILRTDEIGTIGFTVRVDEEGNYNLYYGDTATTPTPTPTPTPEEKPTTVKVLVYNKLWGIELKWPVVAWACYAVLVVLVALHAAYVRFLSGRRKGGSH
ncbi:MAG: hypothetical protein K2M48_01045, partial [Clostridiales bacterium]|nr:hypothetical protein [Clostridiales bacterium]